jgi:transposase
VVPRNHGPNVTLLAALSLEGITAAMTMTGPADGEVVGLFVRRILLPTLHPGQIVLWDNLSAHTNAALRQLIAERGCEVRFLPPYSPDFNPIEQVFAKLKALLRKAAARTVDALWAAIATALDAFTPDQCANYFTNSGYEPD